MSIIQTKESQPSSTTLNGIFPQEVLHQIFNFADLDGEGLKACGLVCKWWRRAIANTEVVQCNQLWHKCCTKDISSKMQKNRFEKIKLTSTYSYSIDYKNLHDKYTATKFSFRFFRGIRNDIEMMKNENTPLKEKAGTGVSYVLCAPCFLCICGPCWSLHDVASRVKHAWANKVCNCQSCDDTRVRLFSWDADARKQKELEEKWRFDERQRNYDTCGPY